MLGKLARHFSIISRFAVGPGVALNSMLHESVLRYSGRLPNVRRLSVDSECLCRSRRCLMASDDETPFITPLHSAQYLLRSIVANRW